MTTKEEIQQSINSRLTSSATQIEGGTIQDIIGSVSYELANILDTKINTILDNAFVSTADEEHLIIKGEELGIVKKDATYAVVTAQITGADSNLTITTDIMAKTSDEIIFQAAYETVTDETGSAEVKMKCSAPGTIGNISAGSLSEFFEEYEGLKSASITNEKEGSGGYEEETTEEYRERILEYLQDNSANSNISDYVLWAKSVSGVKNAVVYDALKAGAGKVIVYISASDNADVSDELIQAVKEYIEEEQIINAEVEVKALEYFEINVTAEIKLKEGYDLSDINSKITDILKDYFETSPSLVSYLYISNLLFETDGVEDVTNYFLNGSASSIVIGELQVPVAGNITLTENVGE